MLNRHAVKVVAKTLAQLWIGIFAMQGIFYCVWVPLHWQSLLLVGVIISVAQAIRVIRAPRSVAPGTST